MQETVTEDSYDMKDSNHEGILCKSYVSHTCFRKDHDAGRVLLTVSTTILSYWKSQVFLFSHICSANVELINLNSIHQLNSLSA
jgi:hypothetical protein